MGQTRWRTTYDGDGCSTTAAGSGGADRRWWSAYTSQARQAARARSTASAEGRLYLPRRCYTWHVVSTEPPVCLANEQKRRRTLETKTEIRRLRSTYWNANLKCETFCQKMEGLAAMRCAGRRFLMYAAGFIDHAERWWKTDGDIIKIIRSPRITVMTMQRLSKGTQQAGLDVN